MKLVTFSYTKPEDIFQYGSEPRLGALAADGVVDLHRAEFLLPSDMLSFLKAGDAAMALARQVVAAAKEHTPLAAVRLTAPVPNPGKILCVGLNYRDHARESNQPVPEFPTVFAKYNNAVIGPGEAIQLPRLTDQVDYEAEFGFVIGKRARHVSEADALKHVAGYLPCNDISARDYQSRVSQWTLGKSFDTFMPMGPALTTADEVANPHALDITLTISGEVLQHSNTRELVFGVDKLVSIISGIMTLEPGDVVSTGTPHGVGAARNPKRWLRPGETVHVEIAGLGTLSNPIVKEQ